LTLLLAIAPAVHASLIVIRIRGPRLRARAHAAEAISTNGVCAFGHPTLADAIDEAAD
jgi:hypothetical protein